LLNLFLFTSSFQDPISFPSLITSPFHSLLHFPFPLPFPLPFLDPSSYHF
jgi:hypothetical protein